jgi:hypothetical protein
VDTARRRRPIGYLLAPVFMIKGVTMCAAIVAMVIGAAVGGDEKDVRADDFHRLDIDSRRGISSLQKGRQRSHVFQRGSALR